MLIVIIIGIATAIYGIGYSAGKQSIRRKFTNVISGKHKGRK